MQTAEADRLYAGADLRGNNVFCHGSMAQGMRESERSTRRKPLRTPAGEDREGARQAPDPAGGFVPVLTLTTLKTRIKACDLDTRRV